MASWSMKAKHRQNVKILDTTLRDGCLGRREMLQSKHRLLAAHELARVGVDIIEVGFVASSREEFDSVSQIASVVGNIQNAPVICALARPSPADIDRCHSAIRFAARPRIHTYLGTSAAHVGKGDLAAGRRNALARVSDIVQHARRLNEDVQFSALDASRTDPDFLSEVFTRAVECGATTISVPDSLGRATPDEMGALVRYVVANVPGADAVTVSVHAHNGRGMAVANSLAAVENGARQVECTVGGVGAPEGNASLVDIVHGLSETGMREEKKGGTIRGEGWLTNVCEDKLIEVCETISLALDCPNSIKDERDSIANFEKRV